MTSSIVTTHYRYKRPPRKRKAVAIDVAEVVATEKPGHPGNPAKAARLWSLDQVFPLAGRATTIHEQCRLGFVSAAPLSEGPYAVILKPPYYERFPISEADFRTLEQELRTVSLKRAR